ncbi:tetratricopeptide repeat protein [Halovivax gelatinilyticus]|uniref:tetratricopeptide repeat protein n=1 Tax=Halovivax gelatinilyticus TaxID=2961597 RepID=UPI0020CA286E|nr:tetratricopeptide repeat protein [Halovivax gelatinilyticus]
MAGVDRRDETVTLISRLELLDRLCRSPAHVRDIIDETGQARSTVHRAVTELTELGLVRRGDEGVEATITGRFVRDQLVDYLDALDDVLAAREVLEPLPTATDVPFDVTVGADVVPASDPAPYRPADRNHSALTDARGYRALMPTIEESRTVRVLYEHVVTRGRPAELVVSPAVFETLRSEFPRRATLLAESQNCTVYVADIPPYGLALHELESNGDDPTERAHLVVHNESGGIHGLLATETVEGISWASGQYERYREAGTDRTSDLIADTDGGVRTADPRGSSPIGQSLPVSLEREGFVRIDDAYFRNEPVASPTTAWRTGLSLAEVHTGYAIERPSTAPNVGRAADARDAERAGPLDESITAALVDGTDTIVLGPPGSGKSTICKQVACAWYASDRGPVIYRDGQHGRAIEAVDDLVATVSSADGHTLVVVEDAVRPHADAIFEGLERLADRTDVSVLLDSRESEWNKRRVATDATDLERVYVPPVRLGDCARLVDQFERTVDHPVDVSADWLWSAVRDEIGTDDHDEPHEMLRLIHRLSTYADPLAAEPTALEESVADVYQDVEGDRLTLSVCLLANALNAAGRAVHRSALYAARDDAPIEAVDDVLDRLNGRILFSGTGDRVRMVHEAWSTAFLSHYLETAGETEAARRFGRTVESALTLAAEPERRGRIESHHDERSSVEPTAFSDGPIESPQRWVDETVDALFSLGRKRPKLAPLFGDGSTDSFHIPARCDGELADRRPVRLGRIFLDGGYYDRAESAFERLDRDDPERLDGLARVSFRRGEYDDALEGYERALVIARETDDRNTEARVLAGLGLTSWRLGDYDSAGEYFRRCRSRARDIDDRRLASKADANLGAIAWSQGSYDAAREHFTAFLEGARQIGDRDGEARSLNNLGSVAYHLGAYDRARGRFEASLAIRREIGYRSGEASCLNNLGFLAAREGRLDDAEALFESALSIATEIGYPRERGQASRGLGIVARDRGEHEAAERHFEASQSTFDETGNRSYEARAGVDWAQLALDRGERDVARTRVERLLDLAESLDSVHVSARCRRLLGEIDAETGEYQRSRARFRAAFEEFEDCRSLDLALETLEDLIAVCEEMGDADAARGYVAQSRALVRDAPAATADRHRERIDACGRRFERTSPDRAG